MKRDMGLLRKILFLAEQKIVPLSVDEVYLEDYEKDIISYHFYLAGDAGLVRLAEEVSQKTKGLIRPYILAMTWIGHEFIDSSRDELVWEKAMRRMVKVSGSMPFDELMKLLKNLIHEIIYDKK